MEDSLNLANVVELRAEGNISVVSPVSSVEPLVLLDSVWLSVMLLVCERSGDVTLSLHQMSM